MDRAYLRGESGSVFEGITQKLSLGIVNASEQI
jgi:hypothetical protein